MGRIIWVGLHGYMCRIALVGLLGFMRRIRVTRLGLGLGSQGLMGDFEMLSDRGIIIGLHK